MTNFWDFSSELAGGKEGAVMMESTARGLNSWRKGLENYWQRLARIASNPDSRLMRTDHKWPRETVYVTLIRRTHWQGYVLHHIHARTISMMEVEGGLNVRKQERKGN
jgi:hypothetical protein